MTISVLLRNALPGAALLAPLFCVAQAYEDWTVQCDNVNRCEAVGYAPERETARWLAVQLVREAGPATAVDARIVLSEEYGPADPVAMTMTVDRHRPLTVQANRPLPPDAARELVRRMIEGKAGKASDGEQQWTLPLRGAKAALSRMDALQGRIGSPGALARRGKRPEAAVPPAPAMPVVHAAPRAQRVDSADIKSALLAEAGLEPGERIESHALHRLADGRLLLLFETARGTRSLFHEVWLANGQPPYQPRRLSLPTLGPADDVLVNTYFDGQVLGSSSERMLYDCMDVAEWLWTGNRFELLRLAHADHCYGMMNLIENRKWVARKVP